MKTKRLKRCLIATVSRKHFEGSTETGDAVLRTVSYKVSLHQLGADYYFSAWRQGEGDLRRFRRMSRGFGSRYRAYLDAVKKGFLFECSCCGITHILDTDTKELMTLKQFVKNIGRFII